MTGVGPGTGAALVRRFARGGYRVAMLARSAERLQALEAEIPGAKAYAVDVADLGALARTCEAVRADLGAPAVAIHNAVAGGFETYDQVKPEALEARFRINVSALLVLAQAVAPAIIAGAARSSRRATPRRCAASRSRPASPPPRPRSASSASRSRGRSARRASTSPTC